MRKHTARRDLSAVCVLLTLAVGCANPFEPPLGTPHMKGTWTGAAKNVTLTLIVGSVQDCREFFCISDSGPIAGGSYSDATLRIQGSILAGGHYIVDPCHCSTPVTDITSGSIDMLPAQVSQGTAESRVYFTPVQFDGNFTSSTTLVGTAIFSNSVTADAVTITLVKQ